MYEGWSCSLFLSLELMHSIVGRFLIEYSRILHSKFRLRFSNLRRPGTGGGTPGILLLTALAGNFLAGVGFFLGVSSSELLSAFFGAFFAGVGFYFTIYIYYKMKRKIPELATEVNQQANKRKFQQCNVCKTNVRKDNLENHIFGKTCTKKAMKLGIIFNTHVHRQFVKQIKSLNMVINHIIDSPH